MKLYTDCKTAVDLISKNRFNNSSTSEDSDESSIQSLSFKPIYSKFIGSIDSRRITIKRIEGHKRKVIKHVKMKN